ncbi:MAG: hypothetical protein AAF291_03370 [Pseudomonadota bacterium]
MSSEEEDAEMNTVMMERDGMARERGALEKFVRGLVPWIAIGAVSGFLFGLFAGWNDMDMDPLLDAIMAPFRNLAFTVAVLLVIGYVSGGVIGLAATRYPKALAKTLEVEPEDISDQPELYRLQSLAALAFGLALAVLLAARPLEWIAPEIAFGGFILCVVLGAFAYIKSLPKMDELLRAASAEATVIAYNLVLIFGGGWAVLGHLGIAPGPSFLAIVNILWGMMILATIWSGTKRGLYNG